MDRGRGYSPSQAARRASTRNRGRRPRRPQARPDVPRTVVDTLETAARVYRHAWWPAHRRANQAWVQGITPPIDQHGAAIVAFLTRAYQLPWPENGYPVHVCAFTNWAGAYSTDGPLLVISSLDNGAMGSSMLELVFHEASHQWDGPLLDQLAEIGHTMDKRVPTGLTHAMIWLTSGEAVRRVIPGHTPIARIGRHLAARRQSSIPAVGRGGLAPISQRPRNCDEALVALMKRVS